MTHPSGLPDPLRVPAKAKLPTGKMALYIGSSPLDNISHILPLVSADIYVLSDFDFNAKETVIAFSDCTIITTNANGFDFPVDNLGYVMIDQAAMITGWRTYLLKLRKGTIVYFHLALDEELPEEYKAEGLKHLDYNLFIKV